MLKNNEVKMKKEISDIYENIYNQELKNRCDLDGKFGSRFTIFMALVTAVVIINTTLLSLNNTSNNLSIIDSLNNTKTIYIVIGLVLDLIVVFLLISFYKCFFRSKKNYKVMPTVDIRMFHLYIGINQLQGTSDENDLYDYMVDSYLGCAFNNAGTNSKREASLILFDNLSSICFLLCILTYSLMISDGYSIQWVFN